MESAQGSLTIIHTKIKSIRPETQRVHISGVGKDAVFKDKPIGYYIGFDGSYEAIYFGDDIPPTWVVGDQIRITFQKVT